jgi:Tfp pilus assembly protein FimT
MEVQTLSKRGRSAFTLIEATVIIALVGVLVAASLPSLDSWMSNQRLRNSARSVDAALSFARGEAVRTGNVQVVFFDTDTQGSDLFDANGAQVPVLVLDDGRPGAGTQNCEIDTGEAVRGFAFEGDSTFGVTHATTKVTGDNGNGSISSGTTFTDASSNATNWVLFRPEGTPLAASSTCVTGTLGSGGGGVYLTDGARDIAVVLTPLGASRVHSFEGSGGSWTQ